VVYEGTLYITVKMMIVEIGVKETDISRPDPNSFLIATAKVKKNKNIARFGDEYLLYRKSTRMFIPWLI